MMPIVTEKELMEALIRAGREVEALRAQLAESKARETVLLDALDWIELLQPESQHRNALNNTITTIRYVIRLTKQNLRGTSNE
jgi:asparagine synthetase A